MHCEYLGIQKIKYDDKCRSKIWSLSSYSNKKNVQICDILLIEMEQFEY